MHSSVDSLPFDKIYAIDFEFFGQDGENPNVVCMVMQDLRSGCIERYWRDELIAMLVPPFDTGETTLLVSYFAPAELQCMITLDWCTEVSLVDLYAEFRCMTNGDADVTRRSLISALAHFGLEDLIPNAKDETRDLILTGGPWTKVQQKSILDYCAQDVVALGPLFNEMLKAEAWDTLRLNHALLRGRYMKAVAGMQHRGIPIDLTLLNKLDQHWDQIKVDLIASVDKAFGVYVDGSFKEALFETYLAQAKLALPRLESGRLALDKDTFSEMSKRHPVVQPLHELRKTLGELKLNKLAVGPDGRNRTMLSPFAAKTGRNQPSTTKFVFGPAKWVRGLIKPSEEMALAYCDWSSQEIAIAAALSGDEIMWEAYASGDPYIAFAIQAGLARKGATKVTHKEIRSKCKSVVFGTNYGMTAHGVAQAASIHKLEADALLQKHRETYQHFWRWADNNMDAGLLGLKLETCFGWSIQARGGSVKANTFLNWPMQAHGAEMMRIACIIAIERGLKLCAPIHDALLIEAPLDDIDGEVARLKSCMAEASEAVLGDGKICRVDAEIVRYPDRYMDENGHAMWSRIMHILNEVQF